MCVCVCRMKYGRAEAPQLGFKPGTPPQEVHKSYLPLLLVEFREVANDSRWIAIKSLLTEGGGGGGGGKWRQVALNTMLQLE